MNKLGSQVNLNGNV